MADVDDELLALAGGDSSDEDQQSSEQEQAKSKSKSKAKSRPKPRPVASKKRASSASRSKGGASKKQKRDRFDSDDDEDADDNQDDDDDDDDEDDAKGSQEEEEDSDEEGDEDPERLYPVDGIYKSVDERESFLDMPEFEREEILAQRRDELNSLKQASELKRMVAAQKAGSRSKAGKRRGAAASDDDDSDYGGTKRKGRTIKKSGAAAAAKSRKRSAPGSNAEKSAKLQELKKRRQEKAKKVAKSKRDGDDDEDDMQESSSSEDDDDEGEESSDFRDDDDEPSSKRRGRNVAGGKDPRKDGQTSTDPPSLNALNRCRLSREVIEKIMYRPGWTGALIGCFIRYKFVEKGPDQKFHEKARIHEVIGTREGRRHYDVGHGKFTKVMIEIDFLGRRLELQMTQISNSNFEEEERQRWIEAQRSGTGKSRTGKPLQTRFPTNQALFEQADELRNYLDRTLSDLDVSKMLAAKKEARLGFEQEMRNREARPGGDQARTSLPSSSTGGTTEAEKRMAEMNAKHRNEDRARIYEAEKRSAALKRAAMGLNSSGNSMSRSSSSGALTASALKNGDISDGKKESDGLKDNNSQNQEKKSQFATVNAAQSIDVDLGDF